MDTDNITILEKDLLDAQRICAPIADAGKRNKAVANVIAAKIVSGYFDSGAYDIDTQTGLHNIAPYTEQFEISDIYLNGIYVDVRVYFSDDEICVPKIHFDAGILPVVYMFVKLSSDLKDGVVTGFLYPENVNLNLVDGEYYIVSPEQLQTLYDVEMRLQKQLDTSSVTDETIFKFLESSLDNEQVIDFFKTLIVSKHTRIKLIKAVHAQSVFNFVSISAQEAGTGLSQNDIINNDAVVVEETPNEESEDDIDITDEDLDSLFADANDVASQNGDTEASYDEYSTEVTPSGSEVIESLDNENTEEDADNSEQIETLFTGEQEGVPVPKKKGSKFLPVLLLTLVLCGGGYFLYNHYTQQSANDDYMASQPSISDENTEMQDDAIGQQGQDAQADAMPVETVEQSKPVVNNEESTSVAIPAIERSLDASVLVSNLKIDWEVPSGYASNTSAKRYLVKLGKMIQLNLKTELLLLSKPPLSNKITVELRYNANAGRFEVVGIQMSSGEKSVDNTILNAVSAALDSGMSTNMESFAKLQGNPILIIRL